MTRFDLARNLPVGSKTTFDEMATSSGLPESTLRKLVRYAVTQRIFEEPEPGVITHSAASRLLAENPGVHDFVATCTGELWQAAAQTCNALVKFPGSEEPNETVCADAISIGPLSKCTADRQNLGVLIGEQHGQAHV